MHKDSSGLKTLKEIGDMGSTTLLRSVSCCCSSSSLLPLAFPRGARASGNNGLRNFNRFGLSGQFNPLTSFPGNGSTFRLSRGKGHSPRPELRVTALFGKKRPSVTVKPTVVVEASYRIPIVLLGTAGVFIYTDNLLAAAPLGLSGLALLLVSLRTRLVISDEALEVKAGDELQDSRENVFIGGKNSWKFSTFTNWELWWPNFPILFYFKETQTKPEGQIHFFLALFNSKQVYNLLVERAGPSKTSSPK